MRAAERLTLAQAVERHVPDGGLVYLGNFGAQLFAVGHELIRQGRRGLRVVLGSGGLLLDQLLGAGMVAEATFAHCWSPVGPVPAWNFRRVCEGGNPAGIELREVTLGVLNSALQAGAWDVPFMPTTELAGTGFVEERWAEGLLGRATSPFGDAPVARALVPDIAFVHADACDEDGNGLIRGPLGEVALAAQAARRVVLVTEEIVDPAEIRRCAASCAIPAMLVDVIVLEPFALHPDGAVGRYDRDVSHYEPYGRATATEEGFRDWRATWVDGVAGRSEYRELVAEGAMETGSTVR